MVEQPQEHRPALAEQFLQKDGKLVEKQLQESWVMQVLESLHQDAAQMVKKPVSKHLWLAQEFLQATQVISAKKPCGSSSLRAWLECELEKLPDAVSLQQQLVLAKIATRVQ